MGSFGTTVVRPAFVGRCVATVRADVMTFFHGMDGVAYVTAELTGKPEDCYADCELMICHRKTEEWGPNAISRLAPYTQDAWPLP
jgi:hypothetical protein